ncbi:MAG: transglycosylase SLT domain-containing protein [Alphaproteobacteria bacterium]|nr:transglycosylase SLT domain-containing protein [Alphaproteobacteria bacterium]
MSVTNTSTINAQAATQTTASGMRSRVLSAIQKASSTSGVDFTYLLNQAQQESSLNPTAKAAKSSATGLYQFIDQTWLKTVKENGDKYGLSEEASKITVGSDGVARVANAADKKAILALRTDPEISASMAAELAKDNKEKLEQAVGGDVSATDMYMAHFLGSGGASTFLNALKNNPSAKAADLLPQAASANRSIFYDKTTGQAKSVGQIYAQFEQKFDATSTKAADAVRLASASTTQTGSASTATGAIFTAATMADKTAQETTLAALAGTASSSGSSSGSFTFSSGSTLDKTTASPFATMMLAQMDMANFGTEAKEHTYKNEKSDDERRHDVLKTLSSLG